MKRNETIPDAKPDLIEKVSAFVDMLNSHERNYNSNGKINIYEFEVLKKRIRVTRHRVSEINIETVYCFIDNEGNLLFPSGWNDVTKCTPIRGNVYNSDPLSGTSLWSLQYRR